VSFYPFLAVTPLTGLSAEPQTVTGKWRADCFKSIYKPDSPDTNTRHIKSITQKIYRDSLNSLISHFFGPKTNIKLEAQYVDRLEKLVRTAWDWNSTLKSEVIMLGDFYQTTYASTTRYDLSLALKPPSQGPFWEPWLWAWCPRAR
jgi:hypothetical protein